ncbi:MAG: hypothetical protein V4671_09625 [Armatimonadota bacterium]
MSDTEKRYALRLMPRAERDIDAAIVHFVDTAGFEIAQLWRGRLFEEIASLAVNPTRFPVIPEMQRLRGFPHEFRHLVWRRTVSSVAYRIIFWIEEGDDGPTVSIGYVRHAAARPITRKDVQDI